MIKIVSLEQTFGILHDRFKVLLRDFLQEAVIYRFKSIQNDSLLECQMYKSSLFIHQAFELDNANSSDNG